MRCLLWLFGGWPLATVVLALLLVDGDCKACAQAGKADAGESESFGCPPSDATHLCLTRDPWRASAAGDTTTRTTQAAAAGSATVMVEACRSFLPGQGVMVGTSLGRVVSCLADRLVVLSPFGAAVPSGSAVRHDESMAFNAAIAAIAATPGGTGTISLPDGVYLLNGPLIDPGGANAVVNLPRLANNTYPEVDIAIKGMNRPNWTTSAGGAHLITQISSGNLIGGYDADAGGGFPGFTNVKLELENLAFTTHSGSGAVMVNGSHLQGVSASYLLFNTDNPGNPIPSDPQSAALLMPALGNEVTNFMDDIQVGGYYTAYTIGEHTRVGSLYAVASHNCMVFDVGSNANKLPGGAIPPTYFGNSVSVQYLWTEHCDNTIVAGANPTAINVESADIELPNAWAVYDPQNLLHGTVHFLNPYNAPVNQCTVSQNGGVHLQMLSLNCPGSSTLGNVKITPLNGSAAGSPAHWANSDAYFTVYLNPVPGITIAAGRDVATVSFGRYFVDSAGQIVAPSCLIQGVEGGVSYPLYVSAVNQGALAYGSGSGPATITLALAPNSPPMKAPLANLYYFGHCGAFAER